MNKSDVVVVTDKEISAQRKTLKGKMRHDKELTDKYRIMNLNKYDILLPKNTKLSSAAYNGLKESTKKSKRKEDGRGKHKNKRNAW
jgi:hypothetical protein